MEAQAPALGGAAKAHKIVTARPFALIKKQSRARSCMRKCECLSFAMGDDVLLPAPPRPPPAGPLYNAGIMSIHKAHFSFVYLEKMGKLVQAVKYFAIGFMRTTPLSRWKASNVRPLGNGRMTRSVKNGLVGYAINTADICSHKGPCLL